MSFGDINTYSLCVSKRCGAVWGTPSLFRGPPCFSVRVGRFPVFPSCGVLLCFLFFLAFFCPFGFFLLSVVVVVLSVLFGSVGLCLFGVVLLLRLRFRCLTLGSCVASSGVNLLGRPASVGRPCFFFRVGRFPSFLFWSVCYVFCSWFSSSFSFSVFV